MALRVDLINNNNKSLELPVGSLISSTKHNKDTKFSLFKTVKVEFKNTTQKYLSGKTVL